MHTRTIEHFSATSHIIRQHKRAEEVYIPDNLHTYWHLPSKTIGTNWERKRCVHTCNSNLRWWEKTDRSWELHQQYWDLNLDTKQASDGLIGYLAVEAHDDDVADLLDGVWGAAFDANRWSSLSTWTLFVGTWCCQKINYNIIYDEQTKIPLATGSILSWKPELWKHAASSHRFIQDGLPYYDLAISVYVNFTSILGDFLL